MLGFVKSLNVYWGNCYRSVKIAEKKFGKKTKNSLREGLRYHINYIRTETTQISKFREQKKGCLNIAETVLPNLEEFQ